MYQVYCGRQLHINFLVKCYCVTSPEHPPVPLLKKRRTTTPVCRFTVLSWRASDTAETCQPKQSRKTTKNKYISRYAARRQMQRQWFAKKNKSKINSWKYKHSLLVHFSSLNSIVAFLFIFYFLFSWFKDVSNIENIHVKPSKYFKNHVKQLKRNFHILIHYVCLNKRNNLKFIKKKWLIK